MPVFDEVPHRPVTALEGIRQQGVRGKLVHRAADQDHRQLEALEKGLGKDALPVGKGNKAAQAEGPRQGADRRQPVPVQVIGQGDGEITLLLQDLFQLFLYLVLKEAVFFRQQEQDGAVPSGLLGAASFRDKIGELIQLADGILHFFDFLRADIAGPIDHVGDGGHGHARDPGNIFDGRHGFRPPAQNNSWSHYTYPAGDSQ